MGDIWQHPVLSNPSATEVTLPAVANLPIWGGWQPRSRSLSTKLAGSNFSFRPFLPHSLTFKCHSPLWWAALTWVVAPTKLARRALSSRLGGAQEQPNSALCPILALLNWRAVSLEAFSLHLFWHNYWGQDVWMVSSGPRWCHQSSYETWLLCLYDIQSCWMQVWGVSQKGGHRCQRSEMKEGICWTTA